MKKVIYKLIVVISYIQLTKLSDKDIVEMIFFPVVNYACRVLVEGIAVKSADLDISAVMGMGFSPYSLEIFFSFKPSSFSSIRVTK